MSGIPTDKAWRRVAQRLFRNYEELTEHDDYLIGRYPDPGHFHGDVQMKHQPSSLLPGGITYVTGFQQAGKAAFRPAYATPSELVKEVDRAYYRLMQHNKIVAWFKNRGFDLSKPTIPKEKFEKCLNGRARPPTSKAASADISKFVSNYIRDNQKTASQTGLRKKWKSPHGAHRRRELDAEWRKQAEPLGLLRARGQRSAKLHKAKLQQN